MTRQSSAAPVALLALLLGAALVVVGPPAPADAHGPRTWWGYGYPFGSSTTTYGAMTTKGPRSHAYLAVGAGSAYEIARMQWRGWGSTRAVGTGRVRYCDDQCTTWRRARVVLGKRMRFDCAHGVGSGHDYHFVYRRSMVSGFVYLPRHHRSTIRRGTVRC